jgi:ABC-2 type transport system permease protein
MPALGRIHALAAKETAHIRRDPRTAVLALGMPVLLLLVFGYGVSFDVDRLPIAVADHDRSAESRAFVREVASSTEFELTRVVRDPTEERRLLRKREVVALIVIPPRFSDDLARDEVELQLVVDGIDGNLATSTLNKASAAMSRALPRSPAAGASLAQLEVRTLFNPESRSALFLVPGLAAYIVAIVAVLLTALTVAREWELGSMEQLFATPVGRFEIIVGKLLPYLGLGLGSVVLVLGAGFFVFRVPMTGSMVALGLASLLFILGMLAQGLLISVVARNQMVATQAAALSSMLPTLLLSGFIFPIENMPLVLQWLTYAIPARHYIEVLRGSLLRGNELGSLLEPLAALAVFAVVLVAASTARFQRRLA